MKQMYAIIADDLTGAGDTGVQFSKAGLVTRVLFGSWSSKDIEGADVLVINTDSRFLSATEASKTVSAAVESLRNVGAIPFFKKVDSTLRGQIGVEIDALMDSQKLKAALVCPIFPANGRTMAGGYLLVEGQPVSRSAAGKDPVTPVTISHIPTLLSKQSRRPILSCTLDELSVHGLSNIISKAKSSGAIIVVDAVSNTDLELIANVAMTDPEGLLLVGAAGLANPVAKILASRIGKISTPTNKTHPVIAAVGSVNPVARAQLQNLLTTGSSRLFSLNTHQLFTENSKEYLEEITGLCVDAMHQGIVPIVSSAGESRDIKEAQLIGERLGFNSVQVAATIAEALGLVVYSFVKRIPGASIVATGGDVARSILGQFDCRTMDILDEVSPGIPVCVMQGGKMPGTKLVTKAGGFGKNESLTMAVELLAKGI